jgi:hypothetical protein
MNILKRTQGILRRWTTDRLLVLITTFFLAGIPLVATADIKETFVSDGKYVNAGSYSSLSVAIEAAHGKSVLIESAQSLTKSLIVPPNVAIVIVRGGSIAMAASVTLTINGTFEAGLHQVFTGSGTVTFGVGSVAYIVPEWWGAKCDGIFDDTLAFQKALNVKGDVHVSGGTCIVSDLVMYGNTKLRGVPGKTKLKMKPGGFYILSVNPGSSGTANPADNQRNIYLANIIFEGRSVEEGFINQHSHNLNMNAVSDVLIERCEFKAFMGDGLYFGSSNVAGIERHNERVTVRENRFDGVNKQNRNGISVIDGTDILIKDNHFTRTTHPTMPGAIDVEPDAHSFARIENIQITNNKFEDIGGNVAVISVYLPGRSLMTKQPRNIVISDNLIYTAAAAGISLYQAGAPTSSSQDMHVIVESNYITRVSYPLGANGIKNVRISKNIFENTTGQISLGNAIANYDVELSQNFFRFVGTDLGVGLTIYTVDHLRIDGNEFIDCGKSDGSYGAAILFHSGRSSYVSLQNNRISSPSFKTTYAVQTGKHSYTRATNSFINNNITGNALLKTNSFVSHFSDDNIN